MYTHLQTNVFLLSWYAAAAATAGVKSLIEMIVWGIAPRARGHPGLSSLISYNTILCNIVGCSLLLVRSRPHLYQTMFQQNYKMAYNIEMHYTMCKKSIATNTHTIILD